MSSTIQPRFNREILASMTFEPKQAPEKAAPPTAAEGSGGAGAQQQRDEPNDATKQVIRCMKKALFTSITGISMPEKQRPLDPRKDFTIKTEISFQPGRKGGKAGSGGIACCTAQPSVKVSKPFRGVGSVSESDSESDENVGEDTDGPLPPFTFIDYSPMCYRHIREFFDVDPKAYCDVLCRSGWHSIPTPGKSAAQLFFCGQNWVIKTMTQKESVFLRSILHRYYYHVRDNPHTLLPHFVGHHSIVLDGEKTTFVIMQNVFATPMKIHEKFDLKGSTVGRMATREEKRKQTCTKKDLDINRPLAIGHQRKRLLVEQMKRDCDFLRKGQIMDYSFLVGIHKLAPQQSRATTSQSAPTAATANPSQSTTQLQQPPSPMSVPNRPSFPAGDGATLIGHSSANVDVGGALPATDAEAGEIDERCFNSDHGGMMSLPMPPNGQPTEVYYVGIIDILQEYTLWKRSETVVQGVVQGTFTQISSVDPTEYSHRFVSFISNIIV